MQAEKKGNAVSIEKMQAEQGDECKKKKRKRSQYRENADRILCECRQNKGNVVSIEKMQAEYGVNAGRIKETQLYRENAGRMGC